MLRQAGAGERGEGRLLRLVDLRHQAQSRVRRRPRLAAAELGRVSKRQPHPQALQALSLAYGALLTCSTPLRRRCCGARSVFTPSWETRHEEVLTRRVARCCPACSPPPSAGCASPAVQDYAAERPVFDLRSYFNGHLTAHGMFTDRSGRVVKRFVVKMEGRWQGDEGELDESFSYSDGSHQRRVRHLKRQPDGGWQGRADDVVDTAEGAAGGNAFRWQYTLALPVDGRASTCIWTTGCT